MEMPVLSEAHRKLQTLVGDWTGQEKIFPSPFDPQGGTAVGRVRNVLALDGFAVVQDYEQLRQAGVNFRGHGIFRWDKNRSEYILHWFDSLELSMRVPRLFLQTGSCLHPITSGIISLGYHCIILTVFRKGTACTLPIQNGNISWASSSFLVCSSPLPAAPTRMPQPPSLPLKTQARIVLPLHVPA